MKAINLITACLLTLGMSCSFAQDKSKSNDETRQVRQVTGFSSISVEEGIILNLTQGDKEFVEVLAKADLIDEVLTELDGDKLRVHMKGNHYHNIRVTVNVTAITVKELEAGSGATLETQNTIKSDRLELESSSGATLRVDFNAPKASCETSSGASASLKGETTEFRAEASSGSTLKANNLKAVNVHAEASSGASIRVYVDGEFVAEASSGGSIEYAGTPKSKDIEKSSGGSVSKD